MGTANLMHMTISPDATVRSLSDISPSVHESVFVADGARILGEVVLGERSSVWYNAVLRADGDSITLGARSNVQDNVSIHVDRGAPVEIGEDVSIGHNAVVHGCRIGDGSLIGMGSVVLSGAVIGRGCLVAGGAVVLEGSVIPDGSLVAGVPGKVRRALSAEERAALIKNAETYLALSARHDAMGGIDDGSSLCAVAAGIHFPTVQHYSDHDAGECEQKRCPRGS